MLRCHPWNTGEPRTRYIRKTTRAFVLAQSQGLCLYCDSALGDPPRWEIDHVVPNGFLWHSGPGNLVASCVRCNQTLSNMVGDALRTIMPKLFAKACCIDGWTFWEKRSIVWVQYERASRWHGQDIPSSLRRSVQQIAPLIRYLDPWLQEYPTAS